MEEKMSKLIIQELAHPIFFVPIYKTPEGKHFLDDDQIYRRQSHSVKARKFDTFVAMAELTTRATKLIFAPRQIRETN